MDSEFDRRAKHLAIIKVWLIGIFFVYNVITSSSSGSEFPLFEIGTTFIGAVILLILTYNVKTFRRYSNWVISIFDIPTFLWIQLGVIPHLANASIASLFAFVILTFMSAMLVYLHTRLSLLVGLIVACIASVWTCFMGGGASFLLVIEPVAILISSRMFYLVSGGTIAREVSIGSQPQDTRSLLLLGLQSAPSSSSEEWQPPEKEELNEVLEDYEILRLIGRGAMGSVYKARSLKDSSIVALKLLPEELSFKNTTALRRFQQEARAMSSLKHQNIAGVIDYKVNPIGISYIAMEFIEGENLQLKIKQGLSYELALKTISEICEALEYAHENGVIHRDVKPSNIVIGDRGATLVDFGLAKTGCQTTSHELTNLTRTGASLGTPFYMAPEQVNSSEFDHRVDLYALGVVFYEMLTTQLPQGIFPLPSEVADSPPELDRIIMKLMQSRPEQRYQFAREVIDNLKELLPRTAHDKNNC